MFKGREVRRLVLVSTVFCALMIVSITLYLALSSRAELREQTDNMQMAMAREIAGHLQNCYESMVSFLQSDEGIEFGRNVLELMSDREALYRFFASTILKTYDADYITIYAGGKLVSESQSDLQQVDLPLGAVPEGEEYAVLRELAGRKGSFLIFEKPGLYAGDKVVYAIDNTSQVESVRRAFEEKKSGMVGQQVTMVAIIFLVLMAVALTLIHLSINRYLARPIAYLGDRARRLLRGESQKREEVQEESLFANIQRLLNSGGVILEKESSPDTGGGTEERRPRSKRREVDLVMAIWAGVTTLLLAGSTLILLSSSIAMLNQKADAILQSVDLEMADYYSACYDSVLPAGQSNTDVYIGRKLWKPEEEMERLPSIERFNSLLRDSFDCDVALVQVQPEKEGFPSEVRRMVSVKKGREDRAEVDVVRLGETSHITRGFYGGDDLVIEMMHRTTYPDMGEEQFEYYRIDVTPQAQALEGLYRSASGALLRNHLLLGLLFLLLCLVLSPLSMAWATRRYITRPILELDEASTRIMEGDLETQVPVDENSAFADVARLLEKARSVLRKASEET